MIGRCTHKVASKISCAEKDLGGLSDYLTSTMPFVITDERAETEFLLSKNVQANHYTKIK